LNRELLNSETEYEKNIFKTRIARLSGHIAKIKIGLSNQYEMDDQRQRIENAIQNIRSSLEEGIVPGGGIFYLFLREEISNWSTFNLIGEEILASSILQKVLFLPFQRLMENSTSKSLSFELIEKWHSFGYPYGYDLLTKKIVHTLEEGLVDSSKSVRSILWNSISLVSTLITCE
jgi:chaperonin GroEL